VSLFFFFCYMKRIDNNFTFTKATLHNDDKKYVVYQLIVMGLLCRYLLCGMHVDYSYLCGCECMLQTYSDSLIISVWYSKRKIRIKIRKLSRFSQIKFISIAFFILNTFDRVKIPRNIALPLIDRCSLLVHFTMWNTS